MYSDRLRVGWLRKRLFDSRQRQRIFLFSKTPIPALGPSSFVSSLSVIKQPGKWERLDHSAMYCHGVRDEGSFLLCKGTIWWPTQSSIQWESAEPSRSGFGPRWEKQNVCPPPPSKGDQAKNLYTKIWVTLNFRETWDWPERVDLYNGQILILRRKTKTYAT